MNVTELLLSVGLIISNFVILVPVFYMWLHLKNEEKIEKYLYQTKIFILVGILYNFVISLLTLLLVFKKSKKFTIYLNNPNIVFIVYNIAFWLMMLIWSIQLFSQKTTKWCVQQLERNMTIILLTTMIQLLNSFLYISINIYTGSVFK
jgi:hypothetical protein